MNKATPSIPRNWLMLSAVAGMVGIIALLCLSLLDEYRDATQRARVEVGNTTRLLEEHARATVYKADLLLREVQRNVGAADMRIPRGTRRQVLHALLKAQADSVPEVAGMQIADTNGDYIYSSLDPLPVINIADRGYFLRQAGLTTNELVISSPLVSRITGKWTIVLSRRLVFENGAFAGIALATLNLDYFQEFYRTLDLGSQGVVALYDREFHLAARYPQNDKMMGQVVQLGVTPYIKRGVNYGTFPSVSPVDGVKRQISFRQVGELPLFVFAGISERDYLAEWHTHLWEYGIGAAIFALVVTGFGLRQRRNEKTLRQDDARFRFMLETSPIAVRIASASGRRVLFANQRYAELIESAPEQVIGVDPKTYYADPHDYDEVLQSLAHDQSITDRLVKLRMPGGATKWALASYLRLEYHDEPAVLGWFYDITQRKQMETASHQLLASLTEAQHIAHVGNWELDLTHDKLVWSPEIYRIFEIDPDKFDASYEAFLAAIHPDDREAVNRAYLDSLEHKTSYEIEHRLLFPDGSIKYVHERCESEFGLDGKPLRSIGTVQDITERKQAALALERSEATFRALINATAETVILLDEAGTIIAINEVGAHRLHAEQHEMLGRNFYGVLPPDLAASRKEFADQVFRSGKAAQQEDVRDGTHFINSVYPVFGADGKVVNLAVYAADVTERLQLQGVDQLFHAIDQQVLRGQSLNEVFAYICREVVNIFGYHYIWIGRKDSDGSVSIRAAAGQATQYRSDLEQTGVRWDDSPQSRCPTGTAIKTGQVQLFRLSDTGYQPWREMTQRSDLQAVLAIPLIVRGEIYGAITLCSRLEYSFDSSETMQRLTGIANRICIAIETGQDQQQLTLLRTALSATASGVFITDKAGRILWVNKAFTVLTGFSEAEAMGMTPRLLNTGKHNDAYYKKLWQTILRGDVWRREMEEQRKDGSTFFVRQSITPITDAQGEVSHFIAILEDISAEKVAEARIEYMAHYDSLTNLPNRALFLDRMAQALAKAKRMKDTVALLFLDLDQFKTVNDTLGHHAGDLLLQQVAGRLRDCVRESDTVARLAGDEFTVILSGTGREGAATVAAKIVDQFAVPFDLESGARMSSVSIGIAMFPADAADDQTLLQRADKAMYTAKKAGKNKFVFSH